MPRPSPPPLSGRRVVAVGLVCGVLGVAVALFMRAIVAHTPVEVSSYTLFWFTVVLGGFGVAAGMALEAVRQLQATNPEPEYHQHHRRPREDPPIR